MTADRQDTRAEALSAAIDAVADALNSWDQGAQPPETLHRDWLVIVDAFAVREGDEPRDPQPVANETESGYARRRELAVQARVRALADSWDAAAGLAEDRALLGDPASAMATAQTLRSCADRLRAAVQQGDPSNG